MYKKKNIIIFFVTLAILVVFFIMYAQSIGKDTNKQLQANKEQETEKTTEIESTEITEENDVEETESETETEEIIETDTSEQEETYGTLENMEFIVDVTDIVKDDSTQVMIVGNTATYKSYSGTIELWAKESVDTSAIEIGKTYVFTTTPMMTMSLPPQVVAIKAVEATAEDIETLEKIKEKVSTYAESMLKYKDMELDEIVSHANHNYGTWTQEQIKQYIEFIEEKGYSEENKIKSIVKLRDTVEIETEATTELETNTDATNNDSD